MAQFIIETSARHIHVTKETLEALFGEGAELTVRKMLSQPGQFASGEKLEVVGPKGVLKASILGPVRKENQVELSYSDARTIGVVAPLRESGDVKGSAPCTLRNPENGKEVVIQEGVIIAKRHVHMTPADAETFNVSNGEIVNVKVVNETGRAIIFGDTVVRVSPTYALAMHVDTDEANAGALSGVVYGEIVK
ncbi:MAG: phosphate propanoyltransferase [Bacilli bacterium]|nr:phosphate propanoyltransferase [Erysipelotrichaceae bacterium]MDY2745692.1 phosphate propanoyltransferase [Bacilli bacterium]MDY3890777.1 phosphate propanoyltransferase [Bacilli bacterium]MDY6142507.1 phosphate propanoyltransferase [Bacilli bacterium]